MKFKVGEPVPPRFTNVFVLEVEYMYGDAVEHFSVGSDEDHNKRLLKLVEVHKKYMFKHIPNELPEEYKELADHYMMKQDDYGTWVTISLVQWFYYDHEGVKHFAELA